MTTHEQYIPELLNAIEKGYTQHFHVFQDGRLKCISSGTMHETFQVDELITLSQIPGTLYLIALSDGEKGTCIDWWELFDTSE